MPMSKLAITNQKLNERCKNNQQYPENSITHEKYDVELANIYNIINVFITKNCYNLQFTIEFKNDEFFNQENNNVKEFARNNIIYELTKSGFTNVHILTTDDSIKFVFNRTVEIETKSTTN